MVSVAHEDSSVQDLTAGNPAIARQTIPARHRLHAPPLARIAVQMPPSIGTPELDHAPDTFAFTVEGDVTVASYDDTTRTVGTYEGETMALAPTASESNVTTWQDSTSNIHYRCDQTGNCTLVKGGQVALNTKRTK
jgi:hypothetical protein